MSINRVVVSGNLTRDPEMRSSQSGTNILTFGMAVNDRRRNPQTQEWEDYANFLDCVMFGNRTDYMYRTLRKGTKVVVEGKLRYSSWERDGQRRSKIEIVVDDIDFVSPRQTQGQGGYAPQNGGYQQSQGQGYGQGYQSQNQGYGQSQNQGYDQGYGQSQGQGYGQGYQSQSQGQGYGQGPSYNAPATAPQGAQGYGNTSAPQGTPAQPEVAQQAPAPAPSQGSTAPAPSSSAPGVTAPPETDVYDEDIPF